MEKKDRFVVCVGAGLLVLWYILEEVKNYKSKKAEKTEETNK